MRTLRPKIWPSGISSLFRHWGAVGRPHKNVREDDILDLVYVISMI
jgi:hypothetical protein